MKPTATDLLLFAADAYLWTVSAAAALLIGLVALSQAALAAVTALAALGLFGLAFWRAWRIVRSALLASRLRELGYVWATLEEAFALRAISRRALRRFPRHADIAASPVYGRDDRLTLVRIERLAETGEARPPERSEAFDEATPARCALEACLACLLGSAFLLLSANL